MELGILEGQSFGPGRFEVSRPNIEDFLAATHDDDPRWGHIAPPGFLATGLFVVATDLLGRLEGGFVVHGEQRFSWQQPMEAGMATEVTGSLSRVRERGGVHYLGFDIEVSGEAGPLAGGSSLFMVVGDPAPGSEQRTEPAPDDDGDPGPDRVSASRADLIRYAAATRDWNPIHWDHQSAVSAGLPGVVVHGLLQAAWALGAASRLRPGDLPLRSARVRFRNSLPPATPVSVKVEEAGDTAVVAVADDEVEYVSAQIELSEQ